MSDEHNELQEAVAKEYGVPARVASGANELEMRESAEAFRDQFPGLFETEADREKKRAAAAYGLSQLRETENKSILQGLLRRRGGSNL